MRIIRAVVVVAVVLCVLLALALSVKAEPLVGRIGRAPLFLLNRRFDVKAYIDAAPRKPHAIAVLWDVPHRSTRNLKLVLRRTRVAEIEVVLINETCLNNGVCERRETLFPYSRQSLRKAVQSRDQPLRGLIKREALEMLSTLAPIIGSRRLIVSPLLETRLSRSLWVRVARWTKDGVGDLPLVFNPLKDDRRPFPTAARYYEKHGFDVFCDPDGRTIANLDGSRGSVPEMQEWLRQTKGCRLSLLWVAADNCRAENEKNFVAPSVRLCRGGFDKIRRINP